ncbi:MAG: hypothetical protein JSW12_07860 [Deltaproteobacteria bacterium]|nr:MAG: hypothetical protein JSW12_07860 [Deltaproteobacteria bacterium]
MFDTLDIMISLAVVFLILSMVHKYLVSLIKRLLSIKAKVVAKEMKTFVGENTMQYLIPYLEKKAKHLNFLEQQHGIPLIRKGQVGLRRLEQKQLEEVVDSLKGFLEKKSVRQLKHDLAVQIPSVTTKKKLDEIREHLVTLRGRIETMYDNTTERMSEVYETRIRHQTLIWGLVLAVLINGDFLDMYSSLAKNSLVRGKLAAQAEVIDRQMQLMSEQIEQKEGEEIKRVRPLFKEAQANLSELAESFEKAGLSLAWTKEKLLAVFKGWGVFFNKLLGLFISGLLISFGAPFWHDLLSSFSGLRRMLQEKEKRKPVVPSPPAASP